MKTENVETWPFENCFTLADADYFIDGFIFPQFREGLYGAAIELDELCASKPRPASAALEAAVRRAAKRIRGVSDELVKHLGQGVLAYVEVLDRFGGVVPFGSFDDRQSAIQTLHFWSQFPSITEQLKNRADLFEELNLGMTVVDAEFTAAISDFDSACLEALKSTNGSKLSELKKHRDGLLGKHVHPDVSQYLGLVPRESDLSGLSTKTYTQDKIQILGELALSPEKVDRLAKAYLRGIQGRAKSWLQQELVRICEILKTAKTAKGFFPPLTLLELDSYVRLDRKLVVVIGEIGSGKEYFAKTFYNLHEAKADTGKFVTVNCAALPENLVESELFGHVKGAFTGAVDHKGAFERAEGGTLFLDEFGELPDPVVAKLLRTLANYDDGFEIQRVGDTTKTIKLRLILATTPSSFSRLREDIRSRVMRHHQLLPLREWPYEAIEGFIRWHVATYHSKQWRIAEKIDPKKIEELMHARNWDFNLREFVIIFDYTMDIFRGGFVDDAFIQRFTEIATNKPDSIEFQQTKSPNALRQCGALLARHLLERQEQSLDRIDEYKDDPTQETLWLDEAEKTVRQELIRSLRRTLEEERSRPLQQKELAGIIGFSPGKTSKWLKANGVQWKSGRDSK